MNAEECTHPAATTRGDEVVCVKCGALWGPRTPPDTASFTLTARAMVQANDAAREAHIAALVARCDWPALEADVSARLGRVKS